MRLAATASPKADCGVVSTSNTPRQHLISARPANHSAERAAVQNATLSGSLNSFLLVCLPLLRRISVHC